VPFDEKEFMKRIYERWEKEWKTEKADRVAAIHNVLVDAVASEKAHIDEVIIALELLLQETLSEKKTQITAQSTFAVETLPTEIKG
jgi:hypothetical protein